MEANTKAFMPHFANPTVFKEDPLIVKKAEGVYFWDSEGRKYLDGVAGVMVVNAGYGRKEILDAMKDQLDELAYNFLSYSVSEKALELSQALTRIMPGNMKEIFFTTGGSEATDTSLKVARLYHTLNGEGERYRFVSRWISYHGATIGGLSCSGHAPRRRHFEPLLLDFPHALPSYCYRCPFGKTFPDCGIECASSIEQLIRNEGPESISAFIAEPIVGSTGGALVPPDEYFKIVREICDKYGILLVVDEVLTGFGRTGKMFASDHWGVKPDIVLFAKGVSSGYAPIGGVAFGPAIAEKFESDKGVEFAHGFTFAGSPVACTASLKNLEILSREKLPERSLKSGEYLQKKLVDLDRKIIGDVRGKGLLVGVELVRDRASKEMFRDDEPVGAEISKHALKRGVKIFGLKGHDSGMISDFLVISPPLIIEEEQLDTIVNVIDQCLQDAEAKYVP
jgi:taurine-pyruvate aminotransferase